MQDRFRSVVVASGHLVDAPDRDRPRFPPEAEAEVTDSAQAILERWRIGPGDLAVTAGARGADIIVAELCLDRGATVWLLLPEPEQAFVEGSVRLPGTNWVQRFHKLRRRCRTMFQADELGPTPDRETALSRNDRWCIEVAQREAADGRPRVLVVWDGEPGNGRVGTAHFVAEAKRASAEIEIVDPTRFIGGRS